MGELRAMAKSKTTSRRSRAVVGSKANDPLRVVASVSHDRWLVFVSSALPKPRRPLIGRDRIAATRAISELESFFHAWTWEHCAIPGRFRPDDLFIKEAERAHILILLIHDRLTPNTKKEYDASVKNRRSQMILFRDGFRLDKSARAFQGKLRDATYLKYKNPSELKTIIVNGLRSNVLRYASLGLDASIGTQVDYGRLGV